MIASKRNGDKTHHLTCQKWLQLPSEEVIFFSPKISQQKRFEPLKPKNKYYFNLPPSLNLISLFFSVLFLSFFPLKHCWKPDKSLVIIA